jgi:hypothetical protein
MELRDRVFALLDRLNDEQAFPSVDGDPESAAAGLALGLKWIGEGLPVNVTAAELYPHCLDWLT